MDLSIKQTQKQVLAPQVELSTRILQMDGLQLAEYLKEMALENPVAELDFPHAQDEAESRRQMALRKLEWLESQTHRERENTGYYEEDDSPLEPQISSVEEESLSDHLMKQAAVHCTPELFPVVRYVIGCLDENGYLKVPDGEICAEVPCTPEALALAVASVQELEPAGVGARSLAECLRLQLAPEDTLARRLVTDFLEQIAKNRTEALAKTLGVSTEEISGAIRRIRRLNAKPGSLYCRFERPAYITPDVVVTSFQDQYNILLCEFSYPRITINEGYLKMAKETSDKQVADYLADKLGQIAWIQKCIESRNATLLAVTKAIVKRQERFFRYGPRYLNVLRMRDVAEMIGMHESTVSRAVRDKYLQCAHGVYPLRHFFVQGVEGASGAVSAHDARERIRELIGTEDPAHPLSDQKLADLLARDGIEISRRTVAKYRDALGIQPAAQRRG